MASVEEQPQRPGLAFREKPFLLAIMYPRVQLAEVRELIYNELLYEDYIYRVKFGIEEVGQ